MGQLRFLPYAERAGTTLFTPTATALAVRLRYLSSIGLAWLERWNMLEMRVDVTTNGGASAATTDDTGELSYQLFVNGNPHGSPQTFAFSAVPMGKSGSLRFGPAFELLLSWYDQVPEAFIDNVSVSEITSIAAP